MTANATIDARASRPATSITVRRMDFEIPDTLPEFWYDNDPFRSLLLSAMSGGFPVGERFFIQSVRHFQDRITDLQLKAEIRAFIGQEAHHSKEHETLNAFLVKRGIRIDRIEKRVADALGMLQKRQSPERQLAHTVAIEHFTAILAEEFLMADGEIEKLHPDIRKLWAWHAVEESEHKSVAFDVFKQTVDSEWIRISAMLMASVMFTTFTTLDLIGLLRDRGLAGDAKLWGRSMWTMWGKPGLFRRLIPAYLAFYKPGFHPSQSGNDARVAAFRERWLG